MLRRHADGVPEASAREGACATAAQPRPGSLAPSFRTMRNPGPSMTPKRIGLIGFDGVTALHLVGPGEAFCAAALDDGYGGRIPCYEVCTIGVGSRKFRSESGVQFQAQASLADAPDCDTIIVAGGLGIREGEVSDEIATALLRRASDTRRIATVCTGLYGLAPTGLL